MNTFKSWAYNPPEKDIPILVKTKNGYDIAFWNPTLSSWTVGNCKNNCCPFCEGVNILEDDEMLEWCEIEQLVSV